MDIYNEREIISIFQEVQFFHENQIPPGYFSKIIFSQMKSNLNSELVFKSQKNQFFIFLQQMKTCWKFPSVISVLIKD